MVLKLHLAGNTFPKKKFQSLFFWNSVLSITQKGWDYSLRMVSILVFLEFGIKLITIDT